MSTLTGVNVELINRIVRVTATFNNADEADRVSQIIGSAMLGSAPELTVTLPKLREVL